MHLGLKEENKKHKQGSRNSQINAYYKSNYLCTDVQASIAFACDKLKTFRCGFERGDD
jgi:hypothetical protein